jgi:ankyrin repeat protein
MDVDLHTSSECFVGTECHPTTGHTETFGFRPAPPPLHSISAQGAALFRAAMQGRFMTLTLLAAHTDLDICLADGWTPLMAACWNGHTKAAGYLISQGANIDARTIRGQTALMLAAWNNRSDVVALLTKSGAQIDVQDEEGKTALMWACERGALHVVEILLDEGVNVNATNHDGSPALVYAVKNQHWEIATLIKEKGSPSWNPAKGQIQRSS